MRDCRAKSAVIRCFSEGGATAQNGKARRKQRKAKPAFSVQGL
jgi:hypothetical protein